MGCCGGGHNHRRQENHHQEDHHQENTNKPSGLILVVGSILVLGLIAVYLLR
ncbi:hypothetical protein SAMN05446037_100416 [Anaerovirgula multivorans]|uniref:Uncharacterized protein n=1 Tax=Anaerovirgula multivorans TaxID=312168 RepID=A0A239BM21_9FIRM|nr:hypothetical protein [Anaerovirgula multivorans]SNS09185.1 hypothetical protein SAMN05446037_100416 [Anaerovirgula multivorans]